MYKGNMGILKLALSNVSSQLQYVSVVHVCSSRSQFGKSDCKKLGTRES